MHVFEKVSLDFSQCLLTAAELQLVKSIHAKRGTLKEAKSCKNVFSLI